MEFIETSDRAPGRAFTTSEMIDRERNTIEVMRAGQNQHASIASFKTRREIEQGHSHLSESQRAAVEQILSSRDQVTALEGVAGAGKTTSLTAIREAAERDGYKVEGFAPTSRGRYDAQVYTNDKGQLVGQLARDVSHRSAMEPSRETVYSAHEIEPSTTRSQKHEHTQAESHSISRSRAGFPLRLPPSTVTAAQPLF